MLWVILMSGTGAGADGGESTTAVFTKSAEALGRKIESDFRAGKRGVFLEAFDRGGYFDAVVDGLSISAANRKSMEDVWKPDELLDQIAGTLQGGGRFVFLRMRKYGDRWLAVYRMSGLDSVHAYVGFEMEPREGGRVAVPNAYLFTEGKWWSEVLRFRLLDARPTLDPDARLDLRKAHAATYQALGDAYRRGDYPEFETHYLELPEVLREDRRLMQLRVRFAVQHETESFFSAWAEYSGVHSDYPWAALFAMDVIGGAREDSSGARRLLGQVEALVGADPYLQVQGAMFDLVDGEYAKAQVSLRAYLEGDPGDAEALLLLAHCAIAQKEFEQALLNLQKAERAMGQRLELRRKVPNLEAFLAWPSYREYRAAQAQASDGR